jgi:hypothetical protein
MRLCDEYLYRRGLKIDYAVHVGKGFVYFGGGSRLLSIRWEQIGPHPGFYELSECVLDTRCRVLRSERVEWDDYEARLVEWKASAGEIVSDRTRVFDLTWRYFLRRHEEDMLALFPLSVLHSTIDPSSRSRLVACADVLESLEERLPRAAEFWHSRAFDIVSRYCHWLARI